MVVGDVLSALAPFDTAFSVILGVLVAAFLIRTVIDWFMVALGVSE